MIPRRISRDVGRLSVRVQQLRWHRDDPLLEDLVVQLTSNGLWLAIALIQHAAANRGDHAQVRQRLGDVVGDLTAARELLSRARARARRRPRR